MLYNLKEENVVLEIQNLVKGIESAKNEVNIYCDLMRQLFLSSSNTN